MGNCFIGVSIWICLWWRELPAASMWPQHHPYEGPCSKVFWRLKKWFTAILSVHGFFDPHRCGGNKYGEYCTFYIVSLKLNFWWWELDLKLFKAKAWDYLVQIGTQSYWRHSKISNHFCKISEKVSKSFDTTSLLVLLLLTHILDCGETYFVVIVVQGFVFLWVVWD